MGVMARDMGRGSKMSEGGGVWCVFCDVVTISG